MSERDQEERKVAGQSPCGHLYEICIGGRLDSSWAEWFEGLEMKEWGDKCTMLFGRIPDQAALLGILNKLCGLNIPLVSVNEVDEEKQPRQAPSQEVPGRE